METTTITVYIDDKPYRFHVDIDHEAQHTTYRVSTAEEKPLDFLPDTLQYNENGQVVLEERLRTVEQEQIARLIWQEIIDKTKP
ncbi:hypothetical protein KTO58_05950 [Chitinophaga pendula]|uniref:hypothetical protein n=1 Tax=Chitinophaga TaxID=79328 RepID=UPI000BAED35C|nr:MULTISPECIES: hypothetical protein [Chitinophaga]ASZ13644.1 hypothetical protein CK934_23170 [Chitinophaga sp. MD30]UCJ08730.1 hypothetical protein KTO58_05950 [Chitinophaga pendula]